MRSQSQVESIVQCRESRLHWFGGKKKRSRGGDATSCVLLADVETPTKASRQANSDRMCGGARESKRGVPESEYEI